MTKVAANKERVLVLVLLFTHKSVHILNESRINELRFSDSVSLSFKTRLNPNLVLVQSRKTRPFITERLLMGRKESNQTNK